MYPISMGYIAHKKKWSVRKLSKYLLPFMLFGPLILILLVLGENTPPLLILIYFCLMPFGYFGWLVARSRGEALEKSHNKGKDSGSRH